MFYSILIIFLWSGNLAFALAPKVQLAQLNIGNTGIFRVQVVQKLTAILPSYYNSYQFKDKKNGHRLVAEVAFWFYDDFSQFIEAMRECLVYSSSQVVVHRQAIDFLIDSALIMRASIEGRSITEYRAHFEALSGDALFQKHQKKHCKIFQKMTTEKAHHYYRKFSGTTFSSYRPSLPADHNTCVFQSSDYRHKKKKDKGSFTRGRELSKREYSQKMMQEAIDLADKMLSELTPREEKEVLLKAEEITFDYDEKWKEKWISKMGKVRQVLQEKGFYSDKEKVLEELIVFYEEIFMDVHQSEQMHAMFSFLAGLFPECYVQYKAFMLPKIEAHVKCFLKDSSKAPLVLLYTVALLMRALQEKDSFTIDSCRQQLQEFMEKIVEVLKVRLAVFFQREEAEVNLHLLKDYLQSEAELNELLQEESSVQRRELLFTLYYFCYHIVNKHWKINNSKKAKRSINQYAIYRFQSITLSTNIGKAC